MRAIAQKLNEKSAPVGVVGLGYVGLPLALHMARKFKVIGYDISANLIDRLNKGVDTTGEVDEQELKESQASFTADPSALAKSPFIIVAVPTPIDSARNPDLKPVESAAETVARHMSPGTVVVFESTVYPGVTEDICGPLMEQVSGMVCGRDFFLGYSPERINPGDRERTFDKIIKVVSAQTPEATDLVADIYGQVVTAGIHRAPNIRTAEAAKVIENTQRDLNIALMNELAIIFNKLDIDTQAVLEAAGTKWNFLNFYPGLVGGHCIGVDPYYLTYLAQQVGHHPQVILAGRRINDGMSKFVAEQTIKHMIKNDIRISGSKVLVLGLTFKEDVPDLRNSRVFDVIKELREYEVEVLVHDPVISPEDLASQGETMVQLSEKLNVDAIIFAVKHKPYLEMGPQKLLAFGSHKAVFVDVKGCFDRKEIETNGNLYWRL